MLNLLYEIKATRAKNGTAGQIDMLVYRDEYESNRAFYDTFFHGQRIAHG